MLGDSECETVTVGMRRAPSSEQPTLLRWSCEGKVIVGVKSKGDGVCETVGVVLLRWS